MTSKSENFQDAGAPQRRGSHDNQMGTNARSAIVNYGARQQNPSSASRPPRRGVSVPDLDSTSTIESPESPITVQVENEEEMMNTTLSPRYEAASAHFYIVVVTLVCGDGLS